jgi:hypothetical protein
MTDATILDILLVMIVLFAMPIGFWQGVGREVFVSASILLGIAVASVWEASWGRRAEDALGLGASNGRFVAAMAAVLVSVLVLGYGGGAVAIPDGSVGLFGRFAGAFLAAANAIVLLAWALDAIARDVADTRALEAMEDGFVAGRLLRGDNWILLGVAGAAAIAVLLSSIVKFATRGEELPAVDATVPVGRAGGTADRLRPVRFPHDPDAGKFEPESRQFDPRTGRYAADTPGLSSTAPLTQVDRSRWAVDTRSGAALPPWEQTKDQDNAARNGRLSGREWLRRSPSESSDGGSGNSRAGWHGHQPRDTRQCSACGAPITGADTYCPRCGTTAR